MGNCSASCLAAGGPSSGLLSHAHKSLKMNSCWRSRAARLDSDQPKLDFICRNFKISMAINAVQICVLTAFLLRTGRRPVTCVKPWTAQYMAWVRQLRYEQAAQEWTRLDLLHEVEHMAERVKRLEDAIREAVKLAPAGMQEVIRGLRRCAALPRSRR